MSDGNVLLSLDLTRRDNYESLEFVYPRTFNIFFDRFTSRKNIILMNYVSASITFQRRIKKRKYNGITNGKISIISG